MPSWTKPRSRIAVTTRAIKRGDLPPDCQQLVDAKRDFAAAKISDYIAGVLSEAPPLTDAQRAALAELLKPARRNGGAA